MKPIVIVNIIAEVGMPETGVANLDAFVKMKPNELKMKPVEVRNLNVEVKMNETFVADLDAFVKMKTTE